MSTLRYRRILLKLGGEALAGEGGFGIDPDQADIVAGKVRRLRDMGVEVAIVIGAGNLWRGKDGLAHGMERATADHMGMLATVMNALALADALAARGRRAARQTAIEMRSRRRAVHPRPCHPPPGKGTDVILLAPAPATRTSPPTRPPPCAPWKSTPRC